MYLTFSQHVENLFMRVCIILNTRTHANDNAPTRVTCEDQNWVVDRSELGVYRGFHFMPLIKINRILRDARAERSGTVTM